MLDVRSCDKQTRKRSCLETVFLELRLFSHPAFDSVGTVCGLSLSVVVACDFAASSGLAGLLMELAQVHRSPRRSHGEVSDHRRLDLDG